MSLLEPSSRQRPPRLRRRDAVGRVVLAAVALTLAFLLGIAFARTLDDRPQDGRAVTKVRTLAPLPQGALTRTVTVTVTAP